MIRGIDHIVIVVPDLETASRAYRQLGFSVARGGRHPSLGTANALIGFADGSYLELLQFEKPDASHPWRTRFEDGLALVDFCAQADDLEGDVARFRRLGVTVSDPWPLSRERPDGFVLRWRLASPQAEYQGVLPFLIEDETPRDERLPRERVHPNRVIGIKRLTVVTDRLSAVERAFRSVLGSEARIEKSEAHGSAVLRIVLGPHELEYLDAVGAPADSAPASWFSRYGSSPYELTLDVSEGAARLLDPSITLGARIRLEKS